MSDTSMQHETETEDRVAASSRSEGQGTESEKAAARGRLQSLDAYRGLIMITLAFVGFGLADTAANFPDSAVWQGVGYQFEHTEWVGCSYWDLIQPSFMFMVGVSLAYSYAKRRSLGQTYPQMLRHAITRAFILFFLGIFLISNWSDHTQWSLMNVLTQMGLGYVFVFLLWQRRLRTQVISGAGLLLLTWCLYTFYPTDGINLETGAPDRHVSASWAAEHLENVPEAWHKNANIGHAIDQWLLNLFPREERFEANRGGYQTINFIPSIVTMLLGLMSGELLRSTRLPSRKLKILLLGGLAGIVIGWLLHITGICPLVKRIWTPSWTLFSAGWCCWILAALYGVIDVLSWRRWAFPLIVVGMNSIAMYCMFQLLRGWTGDTLQTHLGQDIFLIFGEAMEPTVEATLVGLCLWGICYWLYRQRFFIRI